MASGERPGAPYPSQQQRMPGSEAEMTPAPRYLAPEYRGSDKLRDRVALITGGDSGIGRSVAVLYAREGADVALVYLPEEQEDAEVTKLAVEREGRRALLIAGDVRRPDFCRAAVEQTVAALGRLDILVNNAAYQMQQQRLEDITDEQFDRTFRTNIFGYFYLAKYSLPHLPQGGSIVQCGSIAGLEGNPILMDYAATKGAIHALTKSLAQNVAPRGIRVNCVSPGPVWTPLIPASQPAEKAARHGADSPLERPAHPEEIAPAFVFFASNADSSYITGEILTILGGETRAA